MPCEAFGKDTGNFVRETNTALWGAGETGDFVLESILTLVKCFLHFSGILFQPFLPYQPTSTNGLFPRHSGA